MPRPAAADLRSRGGLEPAAVGPMETLLEREAHDAPDLPEIGLDPVLRPVPRARVGGELAGRIGTGQGRDAIRQDVQVAAPPARRGRRDRRREHAGGRHIHLADVPGEGEHDFVGARHAGGVPYLGANAVVDAVARRSVVRHDERRLGVGALEHVEVDVLVVDLHHAPPDEQVGGVLVGVAHLGREADRLAGRAAGDGRRRRDPDRRRAAASDQNAGRGLRRGRAVAHRQGRGVGARLGERVDRRPLGRGRAVSERPGIRQRRTARRERAVGRELDAEAIRPAAPLHRRRRHVGDRRAGDGLILVPETPDAACPHIDQVEVLRLGVVGIRHDRPHAGPHQPVPPQPAPRRQRHHRRPTHHVVAVEERAPVHLGVAGAVVDRPADDGPRRPARRGGHRRVVVVPGEVGRREDARQRRAAAVGGGRGLLVAAVGGGAFEARPPQVLPAADEVQVLPRCPSHVADVDAAGVALAGVRAPAPWVHHEPVRVADAERPDARRVVVQVAGVERVRGVAAAVAWVDAQDLARQALQPLAPERADVLAGVQPARAETRVVLPPRIDRVVARAVARADQQRAVRPEGERPDGVAVVTRRDAGAEGLAQQDAAGRGIGHGRVVGPARVARHPREGIQARRVRRRVVVDGVREVDAPVGLEVRVDGDAEQPAVVLVQHLVPQVDERLGLTHAVLDHPDHAPLFDHEHPPARRERDRDGASERRVDGVFEVEPAQVGRHRRGGRRGRDPLGTRNGDGERQEQERGEPAHENQEDAMSMPANQHPSSSS